MNIETIILNNKNIPIEHLRSVIEKETGRVYHYDTVRKLRKSILNSQESNVRMNDMDSFVSIREDILKDIKKHAVKYPRSRPSKQSEHLLVLDPSDIHIGKLCVTEEVGRAYDSTIATKRTLEAVQSLLERAKSFGISEIMLVIGNDVLHTDTIINTTTAGTNQDVSGKWFQNFKLARKMYVEIIEMCLAMAPVHVVFNPSNHDYMSGYFLADTLECWFAKSPSVRFSNDITRRKYVQYYDNMICTSHGDTAKEEFYPMLMASEQPKMWADTKFRYAYLHHVHHKRAIKYNSGEDYVGVMIEYLRSPSPADAWHTQNGFINTPAIEAFIHSRHNGQVARLTQYV